MDYNESWMYKLDMVTKKLNMILVYSRLNRLPVYGTGYLLTMIILSIF